MYIGNLIDVLQSLIDLENRQKMKIPNWVHWLYAIAMVLLIIISMFIC